MKRIKRINFISNLGVYKTYTHSGELPDFNDKNIIYGWNYSGKTTLSRLFNFLNADSVIDDDYAGMTFEIELEDNSKITQSNKVTSSCIVQVFNSDFITSNFKFNYSVDNKIKAITFDIGEENIHIRNKISNLNKQIICYDSIIKNTSKYTVKFNELDSIFTSRARIIKNDSFRSAIEFNRSHLKQIIETTMSANTYRNFIITNHTDLVKCQSEALETEAKQLIEESYPTLSFSMIISRVIKILNSSPKNPVYDTILSNNSELYGWVKQGLQLHTHEEINTCAFCGQTLYSTRIEYLNDFYTNEAAKVKDEANKLIQDIEIEKQLSQLSTWLTFNQYAFSGDYGIQYQSLKEQYQSICTNYVSLLDELIRILQDKLNNKLFVAVPLPDIDTTPKYDLENWINRMIGIIKGHNESIKNFSRIKENAIKRLKNHLVAKLLEEIDYYTIVQNFNRERTLHSFLNQYKIKVQQQIQELETQVKSIAKGKERCNKYIQLLLQKNDIKIDLTDDSYFILKRGNKVAKNLSEGEKSAIAFAYFLVLLDSDLEKLKKSIVVIDDPISSLDANHMVQIASLITQFFFRKDNQQYKNYFCQLFILTHSFEFYSILHDSHIIKKKKRQQTSDGKSNDIATLNEYLIKRVNKDESTIINMPKSLKSYKSEYVYLWKLIVEYKNKHFPEDMLYIMPNIARRFLEIYTLIKLPGNRDEIDNRVKILISDVNELRVLHTFSHFTSLERVVNHNELILKIPEIIEDLYTIIERDTMHFDSLNEAIRKD